MRRTLDALIRALYRAALWCEDPANHADLAHMLAAARYVGAPARPAAESLRLRNGCCFARLPPALRRRRSDSGLLRVWHARRDLPLGEPRVVVLLADGSLAAGRRSRPATFRCRARHLSAGHLSTRAARLAVDMPASDTKIGALLRRSASSIPSMTCGATLRRRAVRTIIVRTARSLPDLAPTSHAQGARPQRRYR